MKRAVFAVAFGAIVAASSGVAFAGGYIGLGIGTSPAVNTEKLDNDLLNDGRSGRLIVGHRFGRFSIEGAVGRYGLILADNGGGGPAYTVYQAQVGGKYSLPLQDGFEAYGRLGLQKQWFNNELDEYSTDGSGFLLGAGFEYRFPTGVGGMSIFVDYQYSRSDVKGDRLDFGGTSTRMFTLGATIGF